MNARLAVGVKARPPTHCAHDYESVLSIHCLCLVYLGFFNVLRAHTFEYNYFFVIVRVTKKTGESFESAKMNAAYALETGINSRERRRFFTIYNCRFGRIDKFRSSQRVSRDPFTLNIYSIPHPRADGRKRFRGKNNHRDTTRKTR